MLLPVALERDRGECGTLTSMIAALPLTKAIRSSTLAPLASRVPTKVDPASLHVVAPLYTIVAQQDRVTLPAPTLGPVITGGGSGLPSSRPVATMAPTPARTAPLTTAPTPTLGPVIRGGGTGLPGVAVPAANAAIAPAPTPSTPSASDASYLAPAASYGGGSSGGSGASSPTDALADPTQPPAGYASGAPSFSASSFSPALLVGAGVVALGALYLLTRKR